MQAIIAKATSENLLGTVLETVLDGLLTIDSKGIIKSFNPAASRIFGYQPQEVIGQNVKHLMPEPYHSEHDGYLKHYLDTGERRIIGIGREVSARRKDGSVFPMELGVNEMRIGDERMFVGTIRDISERRNAERQIKEYIEALAISEERYKLAIEALSVGVWDWHTETDELYWSPRYREIIRAEHEVKENYLDWEERLYPEDKEPTTNALQAHLSSRVPYHAEYRLRRDDGTYVWIHARGQALWDAEGRAKRMVGSVEDITWRKESEAAIRIYLEKLKRSNQELDDFAYIASHDLKEPIRGLTNNALFLLDDYGEQIDENAKKRLNRMVYLCKRMERLVDDLLYFSRLGRQELAVQQADLNHIIHDIMLMLESTLQEQQATIVIPTPLPTITCDVPRVTELFRNLISNAIKYNKRPEKMVEIGVVEAARPTTFYVKDDGIGIAPEFFSDIFRIFKRLNEEDDSVKGTGVGLTFVKKIVERHGGKIWLESTPGEGTTFFFTLSS